VSENAGRLNVRSVSDIAQLFRWSGWSIEVFDKFGGRHTQGRSHNMESSEANLLFTDFEVRHVVLVYPGLLGKINLSPSPLSAKVANPFPE